MTPSTEARRAFEPASLGPLTIRNRILKAATFEGRMRRGEVSAELIEFHRRVAAGGAGLSTVAYCAVSKNGRVSKDCLVFTEELVPDLRGLTNAVHAEGAAVAAQIGHAGLVAQNQSRRYPSTAPSTRVSPPAKGLVRAANSAVLDEIVEQFAGAARVAAASGFDGIELHLGHNYLLSSFLSPNLNKRRDEYGGSIENRLRFPRRVIAAVRDAIPASMALWAKFNMSDGVDNGLWLDESIPMAQALEADGKLDALELTGGSSLLNGMYFFRGAVPLREFAASQPRLVGLGVRLFGRRILPEYPFEEAFFLEFARQFRATLEMPLIYVGGVNTRRTIESLVGDEGFEFVAMARALLRDPDLPNKLARGRRVGGFVRPLQQVHGDDLPRHALRVAAAELNRRSRDRTATHQAWRGHCSSLSQSRQAGSTMNRSSLHLAGLLASDARLMP
jgi:2,4-dienoyl-CoA reductase-like NADH-dependent reductase (Old Yellow Enzyme family)